MFCKLAFLGLLSLFHINDVSGRAKDSIETSVPLGPLEKMFGNGKMVAATYYFNPSPLLRHDDIDLELKADNDKSSSSIGNEDHDDSCSAPDGRKGVCYEAKECTSRGGTPMGSCSSSTVLSSLSSSGSPSSSGSSSVLSSSKEGSVCCLFDLSCGDFSSEKFVYFRNPAFPQTSRQQKMCRIRVGKHDRTICQYRVDLITFDVAPPLQGNCSQDIFVISGQNENNIVPKICGRNNGQHYYFGVDESGVISFHVMMMAAYDRKFDILITQIPCQSEKRAPPHCLQFLTGTHGRIKSFNYDSSGNNSSGEGYPNDIDYSICLKKEPGFCSVTYELATADSKIQPFGIGSPPKTISGRQIHPITQCAEDFLTVGGVRLCSASVPSFPEGLTYVSDIAHSPGLTRTDSGQVLNATSVFPTILTDNSPGPFVLRFVSNPVNNARGFHLFYRQNPCK